MKRTFLLTVMCGLVINVLAGNVIFYTATKKLTESSLNVGQTTFGPAITSHTFSNGIGTITCSRDITTIGNYAFYNCSGLTSVTIPNSVTTIGDWAFGGCSGLTSVTIPNSVTEIGSYAFSVVNNIVYNGTATGSPWRAKCVNGYVDDYFVYSDATKTTLCGCSSIATGVITIPNSVVTIGEIAFACCSSLTSVTIPNSVTTIGDYAFESCTDLTSVTIPNSVTIIGSAVFLGCSGLTSVTIPNSVTTIEESAFKWCDGLTSISIPNSVTMIGEYAFCGCSSLTAIEIPNSVTTIGIRAFSGCRGLTLITCYATNLPTCGNYCFDGVVKSIPVYVPARSVIAYKNANGWKDFTNLQGNPEDYAVVSCIVDHGKQSGAGKHIKGDMCTLTITPNYGYHFTQWSDGNMDNPRSFILTQDTTFTAEVVINIYSFEVQTSNSVMGSVIGANGNYEHGTSLDISATANYGYHFVKWSDGNTHNPRTITLTEDLILTAKFAKNTYVVQTIQSQDGTIRGGGTYEYLNTCTLTSQPNYGYHFVQWSDGNTDNPRSFVLTQDTTFTAEFAMNYSGQCGDNLYWSYSNGTLTITGSGTMYNEMPWRLFKDSILQVNLPAQLTTIGTGAFADIAGLKSIVIPATVTTIGYNAFVDCRKLFDIYCYAIEPPIAQTSSFENYNVYLHVPCDNLRDYQMDAVFGSFKYIECIGAEQTQTDDHVTVTPSDYSATFTWPQEDQAAGYSIEITKDDVVFCTLKFNAQGQLTGIAFAPGRDGAREMASATMSSIGWQFTVTGLNQNSKYVYTLDALNANQQSIKHYEGEFTTTGATGLEQLTIDDTQCTIRKMIIDNQLFIFRNGKTYNAAGVLMK